MADGCVISPNSVAFGADTIRKYLCMYLDQANADKNTTLTSGVTTVTSAFAKNSHSTYLRPLNVTFIYLPSDSLVSVRKNPRGKFQLTLVSHLLRKGAVADAFEF